MFENDIPHSLAHAAHAGTSFVPDRRAEQERAEYAATLLEDYENLARGLPEEKKAVLDDEFSRYRAGYRAHYMKHLASRSRCVSWMIVGRSNFPVRRMEKANEVERRRLEDMIGFRERALKAIRKALHPELAPVMLGDADADARLKEKIAKAEERQQKMKAANDAIRKNAKYGFPAQLGALVGLGFPEPLARAMLTPGIAGRIGFAPYELTNNNANIRRMKARLAQVERVHAEPATEANGANARLEDVPAENRVRLFFPGKPPADVRERLKSSGFRWTPSMGCWQAYRHQHTITIAKDVAGI